MCGFNNGDINFYCRSFEKALITLSNANISDTESKIELIQWSHNHPLIFYVKDGSNTIHIWDLRVSDMFPSISVPFEENIISMKLSPLTASNNDDDLENTYMVHTQLFKDIYVLKIIFLQIISTDTNTFYVHVFNKEHGRLQQEKYEEEKKKFINYIDRFI